MEELHEMEEHAEHSAHLTKRREFWQLGILMGVVGLGVALSGFLIR